MMSLSRLCSLAKCTYLLQLASLESNWKPLKTKLCYFCTIMNFPSTVRAIIYFFFFFTLLGLGFLGLLDPGGGHIFCYSQHFFDDVILQSQSAWNYAGTLILRIGIDLCHNSRFHIGFGIIYRPKIVWSVKYTEYHVIGLKMMSLNSICQIELPY